MSTTDVQVEQVEQGGIVQRTPRQIAWARFKRNKAGVVSGYVALFFIVAAFAAPLITKVLGLENGQRVRRCPHRSRWINELGRYYISEGNLIVACHQDISDLAKDLQVIQCYEAVE